MTRKSFHFRYLFSSAFIQWFWGMPTLCYFGLITSFVVFYVVLKGPVSPMFKALARESDEPHETHFVLVPWFATFLGGVIGNVFFQPFAILGYLIVGFGRCYC